MFVLEFQSAQGLCWPLKLQVCSVLGRATCLPKSIQTCDTSELTKATAATLVTTVSPCCSVSVPHPTQHAHCTGTRQVVKESGDDVLTTSLSSELLHVELPCSGLCKRPAAPSLARSFSPELHTSLELSSWLQMHPANTYSMPTLCGAL